MLVIGEEVENGNDAADPAFGIGDEELVGPATDHFLDEHGNPGVFADDGQLGELHFVKGGLPVDLFAFDEVVELFPEDDPEGTVGVVDHGVGTVAILPEDFEGGIDRHVLLEDGDIVLHDVTRGALKHGGGDAVLEFLQVLLGDVLHGGLLEEPLDGFAAGNEGLEGFGTKGDEDGGFAGDGIVAPDLVFEEGALTEEVARLDGLDEGFAIADFHGAGLDDIEGKSGLALIEERVIGFEVLLGKDGGVAGAEEVDVARKEEVEGPVEEDAEPAVEAGELHEVDRTPEPPGKEAMELEAEDVGYGGTVADGSQLTETLEAKGFEGLAFDEEGEVLPEQHALPHGKLSRGRTTAAAFKGNTGAIAGSPEVIPAGNGEGAVGFDQTLLTIEVVGSAEVTDQGMGGVADGGDHGGGFHRFTFTERNMVGGDGFDTGLEDYLDTPFDEDVFSIIAQILTEGREEVLPAVYQHDTEIIARDIVVEKVDGMKHVVYLPGSLDSGKSATHHDEGKETLLNLGVSLDVGFLHTADDGGAEFHGVTDVLHEEGVLGHTGDTAHVDLGTEGQDEMLEGYIDIGSEGAGVEAERFARKVNGFDLAPKDLQTTAEEADGVNDMAGRNGSAGDFGEERLENEVVLVGDNGEFEVLAMTQFPAECFGTVYPGKATPHDDDIEFEVLRAHIYRVFLMAVELYEAVGRIGHIEHGVDVPRLFADERTRCDNAPGEVFDFFAVADDELANDEGVHVDHTGGVYSSGSESAVPDGVEAVLLTIDANDYHAFVTAALEGFDGGNGHIVVMEESASDLLGGLVKQSGESRARFFLFPIAPADAASDDFNAGVVGDHFLKARLAALRTGVAAGTTDVDDLPFTANSVHEILCAGAPHVLLVGLDLCPDTDLLHAVHGDDMGIHADNRNTAALKLFDGRNEGIDLIGLHRDKIPILIGKALHLTTLFLDIELSVKPDDFDIEKRAPEFSRGLAQGAPGTLKTDISHGRTKLSTTARRNRLCGLRVIAASSESGKGSRTQTRSKGCFDKVPAGTVRIAGFRHNVIFIDGINRGYPLASTLVMRR